MVGQTKWILIRKKWQELHVNTHLEKRQKSYWRWYNYIFFNELSAYVNVWWDWHIFFNVWGPLIFTILEVQFERKMIEFFFSSNSSFFKKKNQSHVSVFLVKKGYVCHIQTFIFKKENITWPRMFINGHDGLPFWLVEFAFIDDQFIFIIRIYSKW